MKKTKVIIPAMAMILFSTAASISGTVAWFTASRVFDTTVANFQVAQLEGNLDAYMKTGVATVATSDADTNKVMSGDDVLGYKSIKVGDNNKLIDGSFNHVYSTGASNTYKHAFKLDTDSSTKQYADRNIATDNNWKYTSRTVGQTTTNYYVAVSWSIVFQYTFTESETTNVGVYIDLSKSSIPAISGNVANSSKGFRVAFLEGAGATDGSLNKVWAPLADATTTVGVSSQNTGNPNSNGDTGHANKYTFVNGASSVGDYTAATAINNVNTTGQTPVTYDFLCNATANSGSNPDVALAADSGADNTKRADRIATITHATGTQSIEVTCVAWFEGTDPNVVNGTAMPQIGATMSFYSRIDAASN